MSKIARLFIILLFTGLIGSVVFLTTLNIPAPSSQVEKVIPDDKFPH
jgi:cell division septal protein FtsQ